jgi:hypothetical protein
MLFSRQRAGWLGLLTGLDGETAFGIDTSVNKGKAERFGLCL